VISPRLLRAYRETEYRACGLVVRIGRRSPLTGVFITAWNPYSRRMPEGWNHRMQSGLRERLRRFKTQPADGVLKRWHEAHLLVAAEPRPVLRIARVFRQRAIVVLQRGKPARLVLLR
jgi:hypothetical protein